MKKTRLLSVLLVTFLCILCLTLTSNKARAAAPSSGTIGDNLTWTLENDVTLTISGTGAIPESCVSQLAPWYSQSYYIETIIIGDGITSIPKKAFWQYENLTKVVMPDTVTSIGASAFEGCRKLSDITLSKNLTVIEEDTFKMCYGLTEIVIPYGIARIADGAFHDCNYAAAITIPSTLTHIEKGAFTSCNRIENIYISDLAEYLSIDGIANLAAQGSSSKVLYLNGSPVSELVIPSCITTIPVSAFYGINFKSVVIPNSVTKINNEAFYYCQSLTSVTIPDSVTTIGESAFANCAKLRTVTIGNNVTTIGASAFQACTQLQQITIPSKVTTLGNMAFADCTAMERVTLGTKLPQINFATFQNCSSLTAISIPGSVSNIGDYAFENCTSLTDVIIGEGVTSIGEAAFCECNSLKDVSFPDSITVIGKRAFYECSALQNLVFGKGLQVIEEKAFYWCKNLVSVKFPDGLTTIQSNAFYLCEKYDMIFLPANITTIGSRAFYGAWHIWFRGTESQWNSITSNGGISVAVTNAPVHFNCTGNELKANVVAPTCTAIGYTGYTCTCCNKYCERLLAAATGHSYGNWYVAQAATCKTAGVERRDCKNCGKYESKQIPSNSHAEKTLTGKPATCTDAGMTDGKQCSVCGTITVKQEPINAKGHNLKEDTSKYVAPTCTVDGKKVLACSNGCGYTEDKTDAKLGHNAVSVPGKAATCTESGLTEGSKCERCDEVLKVQQIIGKIAHTTKEIPAVAATCTAEGKTKGEKCGVCGVILKAQETVPAKGHNVSNSLTNTDANGHYKVCTNGCGLTESYAKHDLVNGVCSDCGYGCKHAGGTATCSKKAVCTICGNEYGELLAHTPGKEADCVTDQTCTACGKVLMDALGHSLTYTDAQAPTCNAVGWDAYEVCKNCDHTTYKEIAVTGEHVYDNDCDATCNTCGTERTTKGHSFGAWETVKEATESAEGEKKHTCSVCGYSESEKIPMIEKEESDSSIVWIIILAVLVVAAVAVIVILIIRKKK